MTRADSDNPPVWLHCKKSLIPDMVAVDPQRMPVWEITGAEFSRSDNHTADGISIRFPRITKQRDDKSHREATNLADLNRLFQASKEGANLQMLTAEIDDSDNGIEIKTKIQGAHISPPNKRVGEKAMAEGNEKKVKVETNELKKEKSDAAQSTLKSDVHKRDKVENEDISPITKRKIKINYKFADSSDEDDDLANKTVAVKKSVEPKIAIAKVIKTEPDRTSKQTARKTSISGPKVEESMMAMCNNDVTKPPTSGNTSINIFDGVVLFVGAELRERVKEELRYFQLWGGQESKSSRKCSHVLHAASQMTEDWSIVR